MDWLSLLIGPDTGQLAWWQAVDRAIAVFVAGLALVLPEAMRAEAITDGDLMQAVRLRGMTALDEVEAAMLERNGAISLRQKS